MQPTQIVANALEKIITELGLQWPEKLVIEAPKDPGHGDLSTNAALLLAKEAGKNPCELAAAIAERLVNACPDIAAAETAGPGFCNITFKPEYWHQVIKEIEQAGNAYGSSRSGQGKKTLVEYVSANPTGPLHVGHGRGAALGDSVARLLRFAGYEVATEYYLNDAGRQMRLLGHSIWARAMELAGRPTPFPEDGYKGDYIVDLARMALDLHPELPELEETAGRQICQTLGQEKILAGIKEDLKNFRCEHQTFFSEKSLVDSGAVAKAFQELKSAGKTYEEDGALWFDTKSLGDDQNRVLRKSDGSLTYFASDIAYHHDKFSRGHTWLVDLWGADHHGYIPRMKAAIAAMGENPSAFDVMLIQMVNLVRGGSLVSMSTRAGEFVPLAEVIREVGVDAARFMFLSRSCESPLDFDLELAKQRTMENPVYYVQYAHARISAVLRRAAEQGWEKVPVALGALDTPEDMAILRQLAAFVDTVARAAKSLAPHHVTRYLMELATKLHSYYTKYTIIDADNAPATAARLALFRAIRQTLRNGLELLGVSAPEVM